MQFNANRTDYTRWNDSRVGGSLRVMETYMLDSGKGYLKGYVISYASPSYLFDSYLPIAQRMIDSFQVSVSA